VLFSLKVLFFILIPASIGLMVLSYPITKVLFERGAFTPYSTRITSSALFFYALGLVACGGTKVLVNAFYSLHDTMTPVKAAAVSLILNLALNAVLMRPLKVGGLALATSVASCVNFLALYIMLEKRLGDIGKRSAIDSFLKVTLAGVVMGAVLKVSILSFPGQNILSLAITIIAGIASFVTASYFCRVAELRDLIAWITKRR